MTTIQLLGGATIRCDGTLVSGPPAQRHRLALLALVAASWPHAVGRDRAMALLWPEHDTDRARRLLNLAVHVLRRALGDGCIVSSGDALLFDPAHAACDVHAFRGALAAGNDDAAADAYGGPFLDGFHLADAPEFDYWLDERRAELAHALQTALLAQAMHRRAAGDLHGHVSSCRRLAAADPFSGAHARALMLALEAAGDRAGAIRHAHEHARRLREELDLDVDAETAALAARLQAGAAAPASSGGDAAPTAPPLVAFVSAHDDSDALERDVRERLTERLLAAPVRVAAMPPRGIAVTRQVMRGRAAVDAVIDAHAQRTGERVQLRVRLVDATYGELLLSTRLEEPATALDALAQRAAAAVVSALGRARGALHAQPASEDDAEEVELLCAHGEHFCARREATALWKAIACFERALEIAPTYARAHAGIASAYAVLGFYDLLPPREAFTLARQAALTARALNPGHPASHATLGYIAKYFDWQWNAAERELNTAINLDPRNPLAHQWIGNYLVVRGDNDAAADAMHRAVRLAPQSAIATAASGWARSFAGDHERAIEFCTAASELDPQLPAAFAWRGTARAELGRYDQAIADLRTAVALMPASGAFEAALAHTLASAGDHAGARDILRRLRQRRRTEYVPAYEVAKAHLALGERTRALAWLETAFRDRSHSIGLLRVDPQLRALHDDARFHQLLARAGHG